jgi:hypothetical protein
MSGQISRLTTVAHILYDRDVLELRQENERLRCENENLHQEIQEFKLKLFWKYHDVDTLRSLMFVYYRRNPNLHTSRTTWNVWIESMLQDCELEVESVGGMLPYRGSEQIDLDTHLVCSSPYLFVGYGAKLWKATSINDTELKKLKALFDALTVQ